MWTLEQLGRFLDATTGDRLHPLWVLAITTGMRRGELCGLHWEDIDFEQGFLTVRRARVMVHGVATDTTPKIAAGQRRIGLDEGTLAILQDHERHQLPRSKAVPPGSGKGQVMSLPTRSAGRSSPSTSPSALAGQSAKPLTQSFACTTSGTGTQPPCCEQEWTSKSPPSASGTRAPR